MAEYRLAFRDACPITWPVASSSKTAITDSDAVSVSVTVSASEQREACGATTRFLQRRYYECLWLGEGYFPLAGFPAVLDQLLKPSDGSRRRRDKGKAKEEEEIDVAGEVCQEEAWRAIASLLRPKSLVQKRFRETLPRFIDEVIGAQMRSVTCLQNSMAHDVEREAVQMAVKSGPGAFVASKLHAARNALADFQSNQDQGSGNAATTDLSKEQVEATKVKTEWLSAIERRELSLQILLVLEALRLSVEDPHLATAVSAATQRVEETTTANRPSINPLQGDTSAATGDDSGIQSPSRATASHSTISHDFPAERPIASPDDEAANVTEDSLVTPPPLSKKKRKRKSAPARRWTGFPSASVGNNLDGGEGSGSMMSTSLGFPWEKRPSRPGETGNSAADDAEAEDEDAQMVDGLLLAAQPEKMHKRFESLVDFLSLRIVTADLAKDLEMDFGLEMAPPESFEQISSDAANEQDQNGAAVTRAAKASATPLFGTSARIRLDRDERDELHHLCSDVCEPRFFKLLPRQCSILRSRATGQAGLLDSAIKMTPARPRIGSHNGNTNTGGDHRRKREESKITRLRKEADLVSKRKASEDKARQAKVVENSQRPHLKDALVLEQKQAAKARVGFGRASSIAADAERNKRNEVSVKRRLGFARSASVASANGSIEDLSRRLSQSQGSDAVQSGSQSQGSYSSQAPQVSAFRTSKRKTLEPQRFGGLLQPRGPGAEDTPTAQKQHRSASDSSLPHSHGPIHRVSSGGSLSILEDEENPFNDSPRASYVELPQSQALQTAAVASPIVPLSRSQRFENQSVNSGGATSAAASAMQKKSALPASRSVWGRTESQPVSGGLAKRSAGDWLEREDGRALSRKKLQVLPTDSDPASTGDGHGMIHRGEADESAEEDEDDDDDEVEEEQEEEMLVVTKRPLLHSWSTGALGFGGSGLAQSHSQSQVKSPVITLEPINADAHLSAPTMPARGGTDHYLQPDAAVPMLGSLDRWKKSTS